MQILFDFFPLILFFICYKFFGIYVATAAAMATSCIQVLVYRLRHQRFETMQLVGMGLILVLGGLTLIFHNPWFIKWKPTVIYWLSAAALISSSWLSSKPLVQRLMEKNIQLPEKIWKKLNHAWTVFFVILGFANIFVAYQFDTDTWVNFKLFGGTSSMIIFILIQAYYLAKHEISSTSNENSSS
jgi:intracellular septation protein